MAHRRVCCTIVNSSPSLNLIESIGIRIVCVASHGKSLDPLQQGPDNEIPMLEPVACLAAHTQYCLE
jgi:hypothetical protein